MMFTRITYLHATGQLVAVETSQRPFKAAQPTMSLHAAAPDGEGEEIGPLNTQCVGLVHFLDNDTGEAGLVHAWLEGVDCRDREAVRAAVATHRKVYPAPTHLRGLARAASGLSSVVRAWTLCTAPDAPGAALWRVSLPQSALKACEVMRAKRSPEGHRLFGFERSIQHTSDLRAAHALARRHQRDPSLAAWYETEPARRAAEEANRERRAQLMGFKSFKAYTKARQAGQRFQQRQAAADSAWGDMVKSIKEKQR